MEDNNSIDSTNELDTEGLKEFICSFLNEKKAEHVRVLDMLEDVPIARYMIFASGRSTKNINSIAELLALELKHKFDFKAYIEGSQGSDWVLVDAGDVIVHVFCPEAREKFKLEEFWGKKHKK